MSTQQQPQHHDTSQQPPTEQDDSDDARIATGEDFAAFTELVAHDARICNNCFALRQEDHQHFRTSGGSATGGGWRDDQTADRFCTECHAGTGKPSLHRPHDGEWDDENEEWTTESGRPAVDYSNVHCQLGDRFISDMAGTVERDWGKDDPLPKNGDQVSLFRNLARLRDRIEEKGYDVDWGAWKDGAEHLKARYPTLDREIFARLVGQLAATQQDTGEPATA